MPKKSKQKPQIDSKKSSQTEQSQSKPTDYEQFLIDKISKCERVVDDLEHNPVWGEIRADYETTAKGLDLSWAFEDPTSPRMKMMQASKMAVQNLLNLLPAYKHDLDLARKELGEFRTPETVVKKDYDSEGIKPSKTVSSVQSNAYHE
jgi:hypothetical protein